MDPTIPVLIAIDKDSIPTSGNDGAESGVRSELIMTAL